jgi:hypothetical protein
LVSTGRRIEELPADEVRKLILAHDSPWRGDPEELFDGTVAGTANGRVYVPDGGRLPTRSTGYWIPDAELIKRIAFGKAKFVYVGESELDEFVWIGMAGWPIRRYESLRGASSAYRSRAGLARAPRPLATTCRSQAFTEPAHHAKLRTSSGPTAPVAASACLFTYTVGATATAAALSATNAVCPSPAKPHPAPTELVAEPQ